MYYAFINSVLAGKAAGAFCWMLVHSLWQGLLFTIITGIVMMATKKSTSLVRYNIMVALFILFIAGCAATFTWEFIIVNKPAINQQIIAVAVTESGLQVMLQKFSAYFTNNAPLILALWGIIFLVKCVRMMAGVAYSQRVRHYKKQPAPEYWQNKITELCRQLKVNKQVLLLQSGIIKIPVVIGHLKPVIFIPLGLLNNLPAGEIEAVLLHELAHIRRNDYIVNLVQVMVENVFFFNPALLWMSSIIREERENCCDDIAVEQTKSKKQFIQALISFKEHALHANSYTTAFPAKKNQLLQRVTRIISNKNKTLNTTEKAFFMVSFVLLAGLIVMVTKSIGAVKTTPQKVAHSSAAAVIKKPQANTVFVAANRQVTKNNAAPVAKQAKASTVNESYVAYQQVEYKADEQNESNEPAEGSKLAKTAVFTEPVSNKEAEPNNKQDELDRLQAERDRMQADADRKQADRDRAQADLDRQQAMKDQEQAKLDQLQAMRDREQAERDRKQAEIDRQQAERDRQEAMKQTPTKPIPPVKAIKA